MQILKNILIGFAVSFLGSIPLGYLNIIGFTIYNACGIQSTVFYLLGVIAIEFLVVYGTLLFANRLNRNKKLLRFIEIFSFVFMFILAFVFYLNANSTETNKTVFYSIKHNFFFAGILYSSLNFIQIPFWLSWNLYLLNKNYINIFNTRKYFYVAGTLAGTLAGMLTLIFSLHFLTLEIEFFKLFLLRFIIPIVFVIIGVFQMVKFYRKYKR